MKKLSWLLIMALVVSMFAFTASAEGEYAQAPMLDARVESGELPPVEERLPENPRVAKEILDEYLDMEIGNYGGTLRLITKAVNWDADVFVGNNEAILTMESANSDVITPNVVEEFTANEDNTVFTFKIRKGLKWSDGTEVTMDDWKFGIEHHIFNEEITPVVAAYMRDGGTAEGDPFTFTVIDDQTFTLTFKESYGGFAVHISITGWKGYSDILKPAHFLKPFHPAFAEECHGSLDAYYEYIAPFGAKMGYDDVTEEGVWTYIYNQIDMTNWECTDPNDALTNVYFEGLIDTNFPHLYPWLMTKCENGITTWERNPYYFKVDEDGNQLPYIDYVTSKLVEDMEMVQLEYMSGGADFGRESATVDNVSLYRENEATAGITAYMTPTHTNPTAVKFNLNYGLNADGTVKDDDASKAWQEVATDIRFRNALAYAIDANEIIDSVYNGFGEPNTTYFPECVGDTETANALLDEMGMIDLDGDGLRETPSGLKFHFQIWNNQEANDFIPFCELLVEFWTGIGVSCEVYTTEPSLLSASQEANELPMRISWIHSGQLWHNLDFNVGMCILWGNWIDAGGLSGVEAASAHLEPPQEYKDLALKAQSLMTVDPETAVNEVLPEVLQINADNKYTIEPETNVMQCVIINSDIGNVPTGGVGISWNFAMEQLFYNNPDQH